MTATTEDGDEEEVEQEFTEDVQIVIRAYKYDPFIFALSKVLIHYFIHKNCALSSIEFYPGLLHAFKNLLTIQLGIYHTSSRTWVTSPSCLVLPTWLWRSTLSLRTTKCSVSQGG